MQDRVKIRSSFQPDPYYSEKYATFGDRLSAARENAKISQSLLASKLGVSIKTLRAWEQDMSEPRANKLQMVSAILNVSLVWLISGLGNGVIPPNEGFRDYHSSLADILSKVQGIALELKNLNDQLQSLEESVKSKIKECVKD